MKKSSILLFGLIFMPACIVLPPSTNTGPSPSPSVSSSPSSTTGTTVSPSVSPSASVTPVTSATPSASVPSLTKGLIAYLPFNGNANDESVNPTITRVEGATLTKNRFGVDNKAYYFDGKSNYIYSNLDINPSKYPNLTITAWVRYTGEIINNKIAMVVSQDNGGYDRSFGIDHRGGGFGWSAFAGTGVLGFKPIEKDKWTFLAIEYNQGKKVTNFYVNQEKITKENSETGTGNNFIRIGSNPGYGQFFQGDIDQVRIYNGSLSESEIKDIYNAVE